MSTRMKHMITSINGDEEKSSIRDFVDTRFLAIDAREFRKHIKNFQPDVNMRVTVETPEDDDEIELPIGLKFFWPDVDL